jgi:hypothetical protein
MSERITHQEVLAAMGAAATDAEAEAMLELLDESNIRDLNEIGENAWFTEWIPRAIERTHTK